MRGSGRAAAAASWVAGPDRGSPCAAAGAAELELELLELELELRSALVSRVVADVLNDPDTGAQLQHQSRFALARFSREQELEADATGVRTLAKAGYDPFAAGRFLTALNRSTALKAGGST